MDAAEQNHLLPKKKKSETEDDKRFVYISAELVPFFLKLYEFDVSEKLYLSNRRKRIVAGSLLKAVVRPGGGDSSPKDADQVLLIWFI